MIEKLKYDLQVEQANLEALEEDKHRTVHDFDRRINLSKARIAELAQELILYAMKLGRKQS